MLGQYNWMTYGDVYTKVTNFGSGLLALGKTPGKNICIFAETSPWWMISAQACFKHNFPGMNVEDIKYIGFSGCPRILHSS